MVGSREEAARSRTGDIRCQTSGTAKPAEPRAHPTNHTLMTKKSRHIWEPGDFFAIPLSDGSTAIGQVLGYEPEALNSAVCAFFARRCVDQPSKRGAPPTKDELVAVLFVTRDLLDSGTWQVIGRGAPLPTAPHIDLDVLRARRFVGVKVVGSGVANRLMDAYFGLYPWNGFAQPDYLDKLLISADRKPRNVLLK